jgi:hypothetical protein
VTVAGIGRRELTGDSDPVDVLTSHTLTFQDHVQLWACAVEDDGVESDASQEAEGEGQLVELGEDSTSDFDHGEFGRL